MLSQAVLINFGRGQHEEHSCKIILNLDQWFSRCHLKDFVSRALVSSCSVEGNHLCSFGRGHFGDIRVKLHEFKLGSVVQRKMSFEEKHCKRRRTEGLQRTDKG